MYPLSPNAFQNKTKLTNKQNKTKAKSYIPVWSAEAGQAS